MNKRKTIIGILIITAISIAIMSIVDAIINPGYMYKSAIKIIMFLFIPLIYIFCDSNINLKDIFKVKSKKKLIISTILGLLVYLIILGAYLILKKYIDLDSIKNILAENLKVNKNNFIFVALYISFINSLLEEFFFRGFIFLNLKKLIAIKSAYIISAFAFTVYHIGIMGSWFSPLIFLLAMVGLFAGGIIFNYLNESNSNIYSSWLVHMMANFAINTVGFIMFDII
ncbi:CPBP family intramembrane metalloprotease [Tissierella carlieri]|jgi:membrane protease YdiL (CAAX protease family)|uniref:CPBP family intramembrane metalloprotease n=1 Tax=Tissierella carlieri TaxID=689904 RepID=A0ABT1S7K7_9FIRM|nr:MULTISPECIES: type II CAAX endopeptidase family protein [Tissierella]MCQ4922450.1 CPBP family intramembrane metalloprotease [Tissierella carlieri]